MEVWKIEALAQFRGEGAHNVTYKNWVITWSQRMLFSSHTEMETHFVSLNTKPNSGPELFLTRKGYFCFLFRVNAYDALCVKAVPFGLNCNQTALEEKFMILNMMLQWNQASTHEDTGDKI